MEAVVLSALAAEDGRGGEGRGGEGEGEGEGGGGGRVIQLT